MVRRRFAAGLDVGGTKCAVLLGELEGEGIRVVGKRRFATAEFPDPLRCLGRMCELLDELLIERNVRKQNVIGVGISCNGSMCWNATFFETMACSSWRVMCRRIW